jgi:hypothetical protein
MDKVPTMISCKDLDYIKDMLNWNFIAVKKANHYLGHIQDNDVKTMLQEVSNMHKKHFNTLLGIIGGNKNGQ